MQTLWYAGESECNVMPGLQVLLQDDIAEGATRGRLESALALKKNFLVYGEKLQRVGYLGTWVIC